MAGQMDRAADIQDKSGADASDANAWDADASVSRRTAADVFVGRVRHMTGIIRYGTCGSRSHLR